MEAPEATYPAGKPLRFYANPLKLLLLLLVSAMFVAIGFWMLRTPGLSANPVDIVGAWVDIGFSGLCGLVFLIQIVRDVVFHQAVLEIDEQGWRCRSTLFVKKQTAHWQDIDHVAMYRQWLRQSRLRGKPEYMYYLVVHGTDPSKATRSSRFAERIYRFYPALRESLMTVPLNNLFVRATPAKAERVLGRIRARYGYELRLYGIDVDTTISML